MSETCLSQAESAAHAENAYESALQLTLQMAVGHHQAGRLAEAEALYRGILGGDPEQPQANHNLGLLMLEKQEAAQGLPHLELALAAKPQSQRYWLSYIDALALVGQTERALQMLAFAQEHGLEGSDVKALAAILNAGEAVAQPA